MKPPKTIKIGTIAAILLAVILLLSSTGPALARQPQFEMTKVIIIFSRIADMVQKNSEINHEIRGFGGQIRHQFHLIPGMSITLPKRFISHLNRLPGAIIIEEDQICSAIEQDTPWGITRIGADTVHPYNKGDGVRVGIIDSGVDLDHPDLNVYGNVSFVSGTVTGDDDYGHGTHVAGTVAALDNGIGVIGVAPEAEIYAVKVLDYRGDGYWSDVIQGIEWCVDNGMQVINMSLGSSSGSTALEMACNTARDAGLVVVAAAGNSGNYYGWGDRVLYPAKYDSVIAVAATENDDDRAWFSSTGPQVELAAPGVSVLSTTMDGGYGTKQGTSMACPHVVGLTALIIASGITAQSEVRQVMQDSAIDLGTPGRDPLFGFGLINAAAAVEQTDFPPVVSDIPDNGFAEDGGYTGLSLDDYVNDPDTLDADIIWTYSDNMHIGVSIDPVSHLVTFNADPDWYGTEIITFRATDPQAQWDSDTSTVTVSPVNDQPVAYPQDITTGEDTPIEIILTGSDIDGDPLRFYIDTSSVNGTLTPSPDFLTSGNLTYTPDSGYTGGDGFTFYVDDYTITSSVSTVSLTVTEANNPPSADPQALTTGEDTPIEIILTGSDIDGDPLRFYIDTASANGTLTPAPDFLTSGNLTYTPDSGYTGGDGFTFYVDDYTIPGTSVSVSLTVTEANNPPSADPQALTTDEDTPIEIILTGSDIDGDPLRFYIDTSTANGTLTPAPDFLTSGNITYTPDADFAGGDGFTFYVDDYTIPSTAASVSLTVSPVNDQPVAYPQNITTDEDTPIEIILTGSDIDGDPLRFYIDTASANGTLTPAPDFLTSGNITYTPDADFAGGDGFTFYVDDYVIPGTVATVSLTVTEANNPPSADPQDITTGEDTPIEIILTGSDVDGDPLRFYIDTASANGTLTPAPDFLTSGNITYTPDSGYTGVDGFTFYVDDYVIPSTAASVTLTVTEANPTMYVDDITVILFEIAGGWMTFARATISIIDVLSDIDENPIPISGATVNGHWELATWDTESGVTGTGGTITFTSNYQRTPLPGTTFKFVIDDITFPGYTWDSGISVHTGEVTVD